MSRYSISDIDEKLNAGISCYDTAIRKIHRYISKNIDPSFSMTEFKEWCNSDSDKPFVWNKNSYYWS